MPSFQKPRRPRVLRQVVAEKIEQRVLLSGATYVFGSHTASAGYEFFNPRTDQVVATPFGASSPAGSGAITPAQMQAAYGMSSVTFNNGSGVITGNGAGQTIAIVDAGQDPNALADLQTFDAYYGLPNPPSFQQLSQTGSTTLPAVDPGWPGEESLDIQWSHSIAPQANIILIAATDLYAGVQYAATIPGVAVVSMSFGISGGAPDSIFVTPTGHTGVSFFAATGDTASEISSPAQSVNVVAVGGTALSLTNGSYGSESAWSAGGGGIGGETQPTFQSGLVSAWSTTKRTIPDVSMDADPGTGVAIVDSYDSGSTDPWEFLIGGTSLSTPMYAATVAVADQGRVYAGLTPLDGATQTLPRLYELSQANYTGNFHDITTGNNGHPATAGYDLATGIGTPVDNVLLPDLAGDDTITGQAFIDNNANGVYDSGIDTPLANQVVYLDLSNTGEKAPTDPTATTNATGQYSFSDVIGSFTGVVRLAQSYGYMPETTTTLTTAYDKSQTYNLIFGSATTYTATATPNPVTAKTTVLGVTVSGTPASGLTYLWANTSAPFGATSVIGSPTALNPTVTFNLAGMYIFTVKVTDSAGQTATSSVTVTVSQTTTAITLSPNPGNLSTGQTLQMVVTALDQFGNAMVPQPSLSEAWSVTAGTGTISSSGLYTAPTTTGTLATITVTSGSFSATATLGVVDSPWTSADIGSPSLGGYAYDSGTITTMSAAGIGIAGASDQFHFDYQSLTANATIITEITATPAGTNAQAGVMFRNSSSATSPFVDLVNTISQGILLTYRNAATNSVQTFAKATTPTGVFYLKLQRIGSAFIGSYSTNGTAWTQLGICNNPSVANAALAGLVVSSDNSSTLATATFGGTILSQPTVASAAASAPTTVTGTTANLTVLGANTPNSAGQSSLTYTWAATSLPARAAAPIFSVNGTNAAQNTTVTFFAAGTYTFTATISDNLGQSILSSVVVTVSQTYTSIVITPASPDLNENTSETFSAAASDQFGAPLATQPSITWSVASGPGSISSTGVFTATASSSAVTIKAASGLISQTGTVVVIPPVASPLPTVATAASATPNPSGFTSAALSVLGADDTGESVLTYTWALTASPTGATAPTFSVNGTNAAKSTIATFSQAGAYTFTVTITDAANHSTTSAVSFAINQTLSSIAVTPGTLSLDESGSQNFTATGNDQFGSALVIQPIFVWGSTGIGSINPITGVYTAPAATGSATVLATSGTISGTAAVTVTSVQLLYRITAADDNTASGVLTDEIAGLTANESGNPTIATNSTPSGASALVFNGANSFNFTALGPRTQDETVFAVVKPAASMTSLANGGAIIGGSDTDNSFEYRLIENASHTGLVQQLLDTGVASQGESTNTVSTSGYSIIEVDWNEDTDVSNFYNDAAVDPTSGVASDLASGPSRIGARQTGGSGTTEYFIGDIAEVDLYGNALTASDSASIEAQLAAEYLTPATRTLKSIVVMPGSVNLHEGATQAFSDAANDQYGTLLATQPTITWSMSGVGSINSATGVYTAPGTTGIATITATSGSVSQSITVTVNHGVPSIATAASATLTGVSAALSMLGADSAGESNLLYTWTATTVPAGAAQPTFTANGTNAAKNSSATFLAAGTYVLTAVVADNQGAGSAFSSVTVTVYPVFTSIAISPAMANLHGNTAQTFVATAEDQFGNALGTQPAFTWSVISGIGSINPTSGVYTAPTSAGSATVQASSGSVVATAGVTVSNAVPTATAPASATPNPVTGTTTALSVQGSDAAGATTLTFTWAATAMPAGAVAPAFNINGTYASQNAIATFSKAGGYTFIVTITDATGNSVASSVSVAVNATLASIVVTPSTASLDESASQAFSATGYDQFGTLLANQPAFTWTQTGGGSINASTGLFVAPTTAATVTVKAASGSISKTATVTVTAPALVYKVTASDYNTSTGTLKDEVAGLAAAGSGTPTITASDTPSGASAITFNGNNAFVFSATGPYSQNQTIFAVIKPSAAMNALANGGSIIGGAQGTSLEYRLIENSAGTGLVQQALQTNTASLGFGSSIVSTTGFSVVEMVLNQTSNLTTFYDNATVDPSTGTANNISVGASRVGARQANGSATSEYFIGDIAEIDVYNAALSSAASSAIEAQLAAQYLTATTTVTRQLTSIVVTPAAVNLNENATQNFTAMGYDQYGAALATQPTFTWSSAGIGSINSATGVYTAPPAAGNATITATTGSFSQSAAITIMNAAPTVPAAAAAAPGIVTGTTTQLSVLGADDNGQTNLTYTWAATTIPAGATAPTFSLNGTNAAQHTTAIFGQVGTYTFTATISDGQGKSVTSSINVTVSPTLTSITVVPAAATVSEDAIQQFTAVAYDQFAAALASQPAFIWSVTGIGAINSATGLYTAPATAGAATIKATSGSFYATASVTVNVPQTVFNGTAGNDTYIIDLNPTNSNIGQIFLDAPETGTPTYTFPVGQVSNLTFTTPGDGSLTIDFANGNPLPANGIGFSGGASLIIDGSSAGSLGFTINALQVIDTAAAASPIAYSNVRAVTINLAGGSNILTQLAQPAATLTYNAGSGSNTLNVSGGAYTFTADPALTSGSLTVNDSASVVFSPALAGSGYVVRNLAALDLIGAATAVIATSTTATDRLVLATSGLSIASGATLDLGNNAMIIGGGSLSSLSSLVATGYRNGSWTGTGITSSTAAADTTGLTAVGIIAALGGTFDNQPVTTGEILLKYTYYGDTNLDGNVDGSDYSRIDAAYQNNLFAAVGQQLTGWFNGDFNYDGTIDGSDYTLIDNAFNRQTGQQTARASAIVASPALLKTSATHLVSAVGNAVAKGRASAGNALPSASVFNAAATAIFGDSPGQNFETKMQWTDVLDSLILS